MKTKGRAGRWNQRLQAWSEEHAARPGRRLLAIKDMSAFFILQNSEWKERKLFKNTQQLVFISTVSIKSDKNVCSLWGFVFKLIPVSAVFCPVEGTNLSGVARE